MDEKLYHEIHRPQFHFNAVEGKTSMTCYYATVLNVRPPAGIIDWWEFAYAWNHKKNIC